MSRLWNTKVIVVAVDLGMVSDKLVIFLALWCLSTLANRFLQHKGNFVCSTENVQFKCRDVAP